MNTVSQLASIAKTIESCSICKKMGTGLAVPGEGNPDADIVFIGEAPGRTEAATGRPFVGRSGKLLRQSIRDAGFTEEEVYITSPVKYYPGMRAPTKPELTHAREHLFDQLAVIKPKLLVLLGNSAIYAVTEQSYPIRTYHAQVIQAKGYDCFLMFHPAAAIRFKAVKGLFATDFRTLASVMQRLRDGKRKQEP